MAEKGGNGEGSGATRLKSLWPFSTRMRLSELDALGRRMGEAEYAFWAESVRSRVEVCAK